MKKFAFMTVVLLIFLVQISFASTVTRSFDTATPVQGSLLTVSLAVNVASPDTFYIIDEAIPAGWVISNPGTGDTTQAGHIKWAVLSGATSTTHQYTINVPATVSGSFIFSGEYAFDSNPLPVQIIGSANVNVQPAAITPVLTSVGMAPTIATILVGSTQQLAASSLDQSGALFTGATVSWSSTNTAVATVDANGVVTAIAPGTAAITATATSGATTVTGTSAITVSLASSSTVTRSFSALTPVACSSLTVSLDVSVALPDTFYIIDEVIPQGWTIANPGTGDTTQAGHIKWAVLSGAASAVNQYTVTVPCTATGANAFSGEYGFDSNPAPVTILGPASVSVQPPSALTRVTVTPVATSLTTGGAQQLIASSLDQYGSVFAGATISWSSSNTAVATVDSNGLVTAVAPGSATLTATATSGAVSVIGTIIITVNAPAAPPAPAPSGGGGGGSSSGGGGFATTSKSINRVSLSSQDLWERVRINLKKDATNPSVKIKTETAIPVPAPSGQVYRQYLNITKDSFSDSDIENATIEFKVSKSWIELNKPAEIYLARYNNGWQKLRTELIGSTSEYNIYRAYTPGFSYFAVVGENEKPVIAEALQPEKTQEQIQTEAAPEPQPEELQVQQTEAQKSLGTGLATAIQPSSVGFEVGLAFIGMIAIAASGYYFLHHRQISKKSISTNGKELKKNSN